MFGERILFGLLLLFQIIYYAYMAAFCRIPIGHDGFQYFSLQYYFLNNAVMNGEIAQWMPYMTQGTVASWWYIIQADFAQQVFLHTAFLFKNINFIHIFLTSMFINEFILLIGCWLLGKILFKDILTVFFFTASIMAGALWMTQPWHNFHLWYCLPLVLFLAHRFFQTGRWIYFCGAMNLSLLQGQGNLPYFFPMFTFMAVVYVVSYFIFHQDEWRGFLKLVQLPSLSSWIMLGLNFVMAVIMFKLTTFGTQEIMNYNPGRQLNGLTDDFDTFRTYGYGLDPLKWKELLLGISPEVDYTLYCGMFIVPLVLWFIAFIPDRRKYFLLAVTVLLYDFSAGGWMAQIAYYGWPLMKYFRGLYLIVPAVKLFIVLMAAFAFDWFVAESRKQQHSFVGSIKHALPMLAGLMVLWWYAGHTAYNLAIQFLHVPRLQMPLFQKVYVDSIGSRMLEIKIILVLGIVLWGLWYLKGRKRALIILMIIGLHTVDLVVYKLNQLQIRTLSITPHKHLLNFEPTPFIPKRGIEPTAEPAPRQQIIQTLPLKAQYWSNNSFLLSEHMEKKIRVDHWLKSYDQFLRTYWGQDIHKVSERPAGLKDYIEFHFPMYAPSARRMAGIDEDKLQFFTHAIALSSEDAVSAAMFSLSYDGRIPLLIRPEGANDFVESDLRADTRIKVPYQIDAFSANHLKLTAVIKPGEKAWLVYSDNWHPEWRASIDGKEVPVERANLANKAVLLSEGTHQIHFSFDAAYVRWIQLILAVCALAWIVIVLYMGLRIYV